MADDRDVPLPPRRFFDRLRRGLSRLGGFILFVAVVLLVFTYVSTDRLRAFGGIPDRGRMADSPSFSNGAFTNAEPTLLMAEGTSWKTSTRHWLFGKEMRVPPCPLPMAPDASGTLATPPASKLRITWLGHSTTLVEIDDTTVLTDPMWSARASPSWWVGPKRFHPPPLEIEELPRIDAVVISHEHYDHLDMATIKTLSARGVPFHVPFGIAAHLRAWGVPEPQIIEQDWWESANLPNGVRVVSTPARHFNGRGYPGRIGAHWTSWSIVGPKHRVFFSGDTGPTEAFREIGLREGPFDVALMEIGQFDESWGDIHLGPVGALDAQAMLKARTLLPIHWATFNLAFHPWSEPAEELAQEALKRNVGVATPLLGEPFEPTVRTHTTTWWRALPPIADACPDP